METIWNLMRAMAGMFVVLGAWLLLQSLVRRQSGCKNPDRDVLDFMLHGCSGSGNCDGKGECRSRRPAESKLR